MAQTTTHKSPFSDKALKQLASILGRKDVKICYSGNDRTARTNGKTITLPSTCMQNKSAMQAVQGYIDHETGHVRWSEFALVGEFRTKGAAWVNMLNILEDVRIELLAVKAYPGMFFNLDNLTEYMKDSGLYQEPAKMADIVNIGASRATKIITAIEAYLLYSLGNKILRYRLDKHAKASRKIAVKLTNEKIVTHITALAEKIRYASSTRDAADITAKIMEYLKQECDKQQQSDQDSGSDSDNDSDSNNDSNETDKPNNSNGDSGDEGKPDDNNGNLGDDGDGKSEQSQPPSEKDDGNNNTDNVNADSDGDGNNNSNDQQSPTSDQDSQSGSGASQNSENNNLSDSDNKQSNNQELDFTEVKEKDIKVKPRGESLADHLEHKGEEISWQEERDLPQPPRYILKNRGSRTCITPEINQIANMLRSKLLSVMRSAALTRESSKRQGSRVCARSVHRAVTSPNPRIFKRKTLKQDINANLVVLVDRSSSTHRMKKQMNDNALIIAKAFSSVAGIDIHVASFNDVIEVLYEGRGDDFTGFWPDAHCSTHTDMAITHAITALQSMPQKNKNIVFLITDGQPNKQVTAINGYCMLKQLGCEVFGIYVAIRRFTHDIDRLGEYTDKCVYIPEPKDLPDQMLRMFRNSSNANYQVA